MKKIAAVLAWLAGFGFGLPGVYGLWFFTEHGHVWMFLGLPTYGNGPFQDVGIETTIALLAGFLAVCAAEITAGVLLWSRRRWGSWLALGLLPVEFVYWIGFALPFGPALGLLRTLLIVIDPKTRQRTTAT